MKKYFAVLSLIVAGGIGMLFTPSFVKPVHGQQYATCISKATSPACQSAADGIAVIAASAQTVVINTTAVTANNPILLTGDDSTALGTALGSTTCNTTVQLLFVDARVAGSSFTVKAGTGTFSANPGCFSWHILTQ